MIPADIFNRAADLIEAKGWFQGMRVQGTHCHCAMTAVEEAVLAEGAIDDGERDDRMDVLAAMLSKRLDKTIHRDVSAVIEWNDADGRTKSEVIALLRDAAKEAA